MPEEMSCKICRGPTAAAGSKRGSLTGRTFQLRRCSGCGYAFVADPLLDYASIYDERYYRGRGADPLVDYAFELEHPTETIRRWEWRGIVEVVGALRPLPADAMWLDYGCGNGGLVRHLLASRTCRAAGFETGWIAARARERGIPVQDSIVGFEGRCDVVSAIDVLEHVVDPLPVLCQIRRLLAPGGVLFLTTGNAAVHPDLEGWDYVQPEVHVSFFEPRTLQRALEAASFRPQQRGHLPGYDKIIRFRILKQLRVRRDHRLLDALPWSWISKIVDRRMGVSAHPVGWAA